MEALIRGGVIDVGTNSVRVLIAEAGVDEVRELERDLVITRLGRRVDADRTLAPEPLRSTIAAIAGYAERCALAGCAFTRIVATSAVRDAANKQAFVGAVRSATGLDPEILSGEQEARLGFAGATLGVNAAGSIVALDIGGGSTEVVRGRAGKAERWISLDIGSVRLTERHIRSDPPSDDERQAVQEDAADHLAAASEVVGNEEVDLLLGLAGTITTAAAVALELPAYDRDAIHGARLTRAQVGSVRATLARMTSDERAQVPVMPSGREDVIVAGLLILEQAMTLLNVTTVQVSETDILDGAVLDEARARLRASR